MTETENKVQDTQKIGIIQKMVRLKQENTLTLIIEQSRISHRKLLVGEREKQKGICKE